MEEPHRAGRGGICGLVGFLDEHYEAVEADLAFYAGPGDQLPDLWAGRLTFRRLRVLLDALPSESATKTLLIEATPPSEFEESAGHGPWSREMHLLAAILDAQRVGNWMYVQAHTQDDVPPPEPTPRPGLAPVVDLKAERKARRYLDRVRAGHGTPTPL